MNTETGRFRKKKTSFTATSNKVLFDTNLDMDTKTLHNMITYYISISEFTLYKAHLQKQSGAGQRAFNRMWKQLKDNGYLVQYKFKDEKGTFYYEYELFDEPTAPEVQNVYMEEKQEKNPDVRFAHMDDAGMDDAVHGQCTSINKTIKNNTLSNKIINKQQEQQHKDKVVVVDDKNDTHTVVSSTKKLDKEVQEVYVRAFGKLPNVMVQEQLKAYLNMFEKDVVIMALEKAGVKQKEIDYAYGILKNWFNADARSFDAVYTYEELYQ